MPDPTPTASEAAKKKVTRGPVNQKHVDALDKASLVTTAAKKTDYAAKLAESEINADFVDQLVSDVAATSARIGKAGDLTSDVRVATAAEAQAQQSLLSGIKGIQAAAKQKYARTTPQQMKDYYVGEDIDSSRARVLQVADAIIAKLVTDTLPGVNAAKVTALKSMRAAYFGANAGQTGTQSQASTERNTVEDAVKSVTDRRIAIQFAADGIWQSDNKANAPIRREFQLPVDRPFTA